MPFVESLDTTKPTGLKETLGSQLTASSTQPMFLSKDRVKQIIQGAPQGTNPAGIVAGLREKGYNLEGYGEQATSTATSTQPQAEPKQGFLSKLGGFLFPEFTKEGAQQNVELGIGGLKSVGQAVVGAAQLGQKAGEAITTPMGLPKGQPIEQPEFLKPKTQTEEVGKIAGDIGQFFIPGAQEEKAADTFEKFVAKYGPEAGTALNKLLNIAGKGAITGLSTGGVTAVQSGGDMEKVKTAAEFGFGAGVFGKALETFGKPLADALNKSSLKLSQAKQAEYAKNLNDNVSWITDNIGAGTSAQRYNRAFKIVEENESKLQNFLSKEAKDVTVKRDTLVKQLEDLKPIFTDERDALAIDRQIDEAIKTLKTKQPAEIPVASLNKFKRSTFASAYNKAGTKVLDWVEAYVGNVAKKAIEDATAGLKIEGKPIAEFNAEYGKALQAKNLLKLAKSKDKLGISGKALLVLLGSPAGVPGEVAGLMLGGAGKLGTAIKTGIGAGAMAGSTLPVVGTKIGLGLTSPESPPQEPQ